MSTEYRITKFRDDAVSIVKTEDDTDLDGNVYKKETYRINKTLDALQAEADESAMLLDLATQALAPDAAPVELKTTVDQYKNVKDPVILNPPVG